MKYNNLTTRYKDPKLAKEVFELDSKISNKEHTTWTLLSIGGDVIEKKITNPDEFVNGYNYLRVGPDWANEISKCEASVIFGKDQTRFIIRSIPKLEIIRFNEGHPFEWSISIYYNDIVIWKNGFWVTKDQNIKNMALLYFTSIRENRGFGLTSYSDESNLQIDIKQIDLNKATVKTEDFGIPQEEQTPTQQVLTIGRKKIKFFFDHFNNFQPSEILEQFNMSFRDVEIAYALENNDYDEILHILTRNDESKTEPT
jgi:hypothetical protein